MPSSESNLKQFQQRPERYANGSIKIVANQNKSSSLASINAPFTHDVTSQIPKETENLEHANKVDKGMMKLGQAFQQLSLKSLDKSTFFIFKRDSKIRQICSHIALSEYFSVFNIACVILNCVVLSLYEDHSNHQHDDIINLSETIFTFIYLAEMLVRCIHRGFILHKNSYIRDPWNLIDLAVISTGIAEIAVDASQYQSIRILRVIFRPLKCFNQIQSLRTLMQAIIHSLPEFTSLGLFTIFILTLFATIGVQQYCGVIYNTCRTTEFPIELLADDQYVQKSIWPSDISFGRPCTINGFGTFSCPNNMVCGNIDAFPSLDYNQEHYEERLYLNYDVTNFNNLGQALLTVFQMITSETWYQQLMNTMDADLPILGALYCLSIIIIGQFFFLNLILAVIIQAFFKQHQQQLELLALEMEEALDQDLEQDGLDGARDFEDASNGFIRRRDQGSKKGRRDTKQERFERAVTYLEGGAGINQKDSKTERFSEGDNNELQNFLKTKARERKIAGIFLNMKREKIYEHEQEFEGVQVKIQDVDTSVDNLHQDTPNFKNQGEKELEEIKVEVEKGQNDLEFCIPKQYNIEQEGHVQSKSQFNYSENSNQSMSKEMIIQPSRQILLNSLNLHHDNPTSIANKVGALNDEMKQVGIYNRKKLSAVIVEAKRKSILVPKGAAFELAEKRRKSYFIQPQRANSLARQAQVDPHKVLVALALGSRIEELKSNSNVSDDDTGSSHSLTSKMTSKSKRNQTGGGSTAHDLFKHSVSMNIRGQLEKIKDFNDSLNKEIQERIKEQPTLSYALKIAESKQLQLCMLAVTLFNTSVLVFSQDTAIINLANVVVLGFFFTEMLVKVLSIGLKNYIRSSQYNIWCLFLILFGSIDVVISFIIALDQEYLSIRTMLSLLRMAKFFNLARYWKTFEILLKTLHLTIINIGSFALLLFIIIITYTLTGMELFKQKARFDSTTWQVIKQKPDGPKGLPPMFNFDSFMESLLSVFLILINDGQSLIYYNHYRAVSKVNTTLFWISFVIVAQKILVNVFIALLLRYFQEGELISQIEQEIIQDRDAPGSSQNYFKMQSYLFSDISEFIGNQISKSFSFISGKLEWIKKMENSKFQHGWIRVFSKKFAYHKAYKMTVVCIIFLNAIQLALSSPLLDPNSFQKTIFKFIDYCTLAFFTFDFFLKLSALGLLRYETSYFRDSWNVFEFSILIASYLSVAGQSNHEAKFMKALKTLKALRILSKNENLQIALKAMVQTIPNILKVAAYMLLFFLLFATIGVTYFGNKLYYCSGLPYTIYDPIFKERINDKWDCLDNGGIWINRVWTFDSIPSALVTLFVMSTTAGFGEIMTQTITARGIDLQPDDEYSRKPEWVIFFMFFMIVGCFFFLNLFVVVVINTFNQRRDSINGMNALTDKQREWVELRVLVLRAQPIVKLSMPQNRILAFLFRIQDSNLFEAFIQGVVICNALILMIKWYRMPKEVSDITEAMNFAFTKVFCAEVLIKLLSLGFRSYWRDGWNKFDFIVTSGSILGELLMQFTKLQINAASLLRVLRVLRMIRIMKRKQQRINLLFNALLVILRSLQNIAQLLLLLIYLFAVLGMFLFGDVKRNQSMNDYISFDNFASAFLTLCTVATVDSWNFSAASIAVARSPINDCVQDPTYNDYFNNDFKTVGCGNRVTVFIYFVSYVFLVNLVFMKLFIAIILDGYSQTQVQESRLFNANLCEHFRQTWAEFDPKGTSFIQLADLRAFLFALGGPLGFNKDTYRDNTFLQDRFIVNLDLPVYSNFSCYLFQDLLDALSFRLMIIDHIQKDLMGNTNSMGGGDPLNKETQQSLKVSIEKEINRLIYKKDAAEEIYVYKEIIEREQKKKEKFKNLDAQRSEGLTSAHQVALEVGVRRIKAYLAKKKSTQQKRPSKNKSQKITIIGQLMTKFRSARKVEQ